MEETVHKKRFLYVFIPANINTAVESRTFAGGKKEKDFRDFLKGHFVGKQMTAKQQTEFKHNVKQTTKEAISKQQKEHPAPTHPSSSSALSSDNTSSDGTIDANVEEILKSEAALMGDGSYQIVPLTLPNKQNDYNAINCYVDAVGKVKELDRNARASRLTTDDIYGDCFLCRTFDDDVSDFRRLDMTLEEFDNFMENPPDKTGRWEQSKAVQNMLSAQGGSGGGAVAAAAGTTTKEPTSCENCGRQEGENTDGAAEGAVVVVRLRKCGKCGKVRYCSRQCQVDDWKFHRRVCK
eukprot:GHVS01096311.1.p1 GENE.GHVS01096311.1~~GHVS01096311.1.p1  ORF type:complete len:294 (+),score=61.21 GHVS01096311.1:56-937(+)